MIRPGGTGDGRCLGGLGAGEGDGWGLLCAGRTRRAPGERRLWLLGALGPRTLAANIQLESSERDVSTMASRPSPTRRRRAEERASEAGREAGGAERRPNMGWGQVERRKGRRGEPRRPSRPSAFPAIARRAPVDRPDEEAGPITRGRARARKPRGNSRSGEGRGQKGAVDWLCARFE